MSIRCYRKQSDARLPKNRPHADVAQTARCPNHHPLIDVHHRQRIQAANGNQHLSCSKQGEFRRQLGPQHLDAVGVKVIPLGAQFSRRADKSESRAIRWDLELGFALFLSESVRPGSSREDRFGKGGSAGLRTCSKSSSAIIVLLTRVKIMA